MPRVLQQFFLDIRNPTDVYGCFRFLFVIQIAAGLTPIHVASLEEGHGSKDCVKARLRTSLLGYVSVLLWMFLFVYCSLCNFLSGWNSIGVYMSRNLSVFVNFVFLCGVPLIMSTLMLFALVFFRHLPKLLRRLYNLERRLQGVGVVMKHKAATHCINATALLMIALNVLLTALDLLISIWPLGIEIGLVMGISYYVPQGTCFCALIFFVATSYKFEQCIGALNRVLKNLAKQWQSQSIKAVPPKQRSLQCLDSFSMYTIVTKSPSEIIQESMEIHQLICEAASTANKYFTYQLLTIISIAFLIIVFDAYYVLETLLGKSKRESKFKTAEFVTFFSCQMVLYLIAIISIVEGSNRVIKKSEKTGGIVHSLLNKAKDAEVKEKLQQFSMQLLHLKINFTAAGLFNIDRTLYFTISGALTTYLIILLQFTSNTSAPDVMPTTSCPVAGVNGTLANFTANET